MRRPIGHLSRMTAICRKFCGTFAPDWLEKGMRSVRYTTSKDGTSLAWSKSGNGPPMVKAANWLTHLGYDLESPIWSHWIEFLENHFTLIRYDERGCGLSDKRVKNLTMDHWVDDLEAVIDASGVDGHFYLLGVSQGAATSIAYSLRRPHGLAGLILVGGYARGSNHRGPGAAELYKAVIDVFRLGWENDNPAFQDVFTSRFLPDASPGQRAWFTDLCRKTVLPETGADLLMARADVNVESQLASVSVPTRVIHSRDDQVIPFEEGQLLAQNIAGASLSVLEGKNHIIQRDEPSWPEFRDILLEFSSSSRSVEIDGLTNRELDVFRLICQALSGKEIAVELQMSEKTVRNHTSNIYAKLNVQNRQQAIREFGHLF